MILEALKNIYVKHHIKSPEDQLLVLLKSDPRMTIPVMAEHLGLSDRQIRRLIASLKAAKQASSRGFQQDRTLGRVQKVPINVRINVRIETFVSFVTRHTR